MKVFVGLITILLGLLMATTGCQGSEVITLQSLAEASTLTSYLPTPAQAYQWPPNEQGYQLSAAYDHYPQHQYGHSPAQAYQWPPNEQGYQLSAAYDHYPQHQYGHSPAQTYQWPPDEQGYRLTDHSPTPSPYAQGSGTSSWVHPFINTLVWEPVRRAWVPRAYNAAMCALNVAQAHPVAATAAAMGVAYYAYQNVPWGTVSNWVWGYPSSTMPWATYSNPVSAPASVDTPQSSTLREVEHYPETETDPFVAFCEADKRVADLEMVPEMPSAVHSTMEESETIVEESPAVHWTEGEWESRVEESPASTSTMEGPSDTDVSPSSADLVSTPPNSDVDADDGYESDNEDLDTEVKEDTFTYVSKYRVRLTSKPEGSLHRPIVLDGSNVALSGENKVFDLQRLTDVARSFLERGFEVHIVLPDRRKNAILYGKDVQSIAYPALLRDLIEESSAFVHWSPKDDIDILELASKTGAVVISKDRYRDWDKKIAGGTSPFKEPRKVADVIHTSVLGFSFKGNVMNLAHRIYKDPSRILFRMKKARKY